MFSSVIRGNSGRSHHQDFSPGFVDETPSIVDNADGTQTLQYEGMALDLPANATWTIELNAGEYYVCASGRTPKTVKGLMKLKRVRRFLGKL